MHFSPPVFMFFSYFRRYVNAALNCIENRALQFLNYSLCSQSEADSAYFLKTSESYNQPRKYKKWLYKNGSDNQGIVFHCT